MTLFCAFHFVICAQLYTFRNYNHRDGLTMESTLSTVQDANGYLWVGTDGAGLMKFDGTHFMEVGPIGKSYQYHVSSIYARPNGEIYFTSLYDGLFRFRDNTYEFVYKPAYPDGETFAVSMIDSSVVVITSATISIVSEHGRVIRKLRVHTGTPIDIYQVLKIPQGVLIFTRQGNYLVRDNKIVKLESWYDGYAKSTFRPVFSTFFRNRLVLYSGDMQQQLELVLTNDGRIFSGRQRQTRYRFGHEDDRILKVCERQGAAYMYTVDRQLYRLDKAGLNHIVQNYSGNMSSVVSLTMDQNNDLWINSSYGLFKVSVEPFTRVELDPIYADNTISVVHRTKGGKLILGNMTGQLRIGNLYSYEAPAVLNYRAYQVSESSQGILIATDKGIFRLSGNDLAPVDFPHQQGKAISLIHWDGTHFWYSPRGEGLVQYNPKTRKAKRFRKITRSFPDHFYTAQNNFDNTLVYFGTNDGIYAYDKHSQTIEFLSVFAHLGSYSGVSTRDRYGTCWFTVDRGLAGITKAGDYVTIDDDRKLPSTLFYTLSSDNYGNLIAGTNKGINILEVDQSGHVLHHNNYTFREGFGGYETNMRSQFQFGNFCYVGTIEGLFLINTEVLRQYPAPPRPVIFFGRENNDGELQDLDEKPYYTFRCLLPKSSAILYSYRIIGVRDKWSDFSSENEIYIPDLPNGSYNLEVRASYDGVTISPTASYNIVVDVPIWRTKWFIVIIVIILGIINIAYLEWSKSYLSNNIFDTKDVTVDVKMIPRMILFGMFVNSVMLVVVQMVDKSFIDTTNVNLVFSSVLMMLFVMSRYLVRSGSTAKMLTSLFYLAYATIIIESYYLIYATNVHPFPLFQITMATSVIPFIISRIRWIIIISLVQLFVAATLLIWLEDTQYNEILFIAAITVSGGIAVMVTYLRNDSLEKLIFVSGVVNKGNVMAISFNQRGIITYCSENITDFFNIDFTAVVGKPSSILNPFVATSEMRQISLRDEFEDGRIFLIPMFNKHNEVVLIEWSCKYFNDSVRVIMGQDVTDKMTLTTNYQTVVESAQDMIYHTDIDANFIFANERCVQLFGYRNEAIIGKSAISLIAADHRERVHQFYQDQFKNRIHHTYLEFPIKSRDGRIFWVGQNVTMVYEPGSRKRISGFIALARDITEKRANDLLIEQQNKDITASINSAKRIQFNLLPDPQLLNRYFDQSFVLFKPKDIVSGDFYWIEEIDEKLIVVLADCTGHGVPGAFMTILGINLLNQIVRERKQCDPDAILNQLNRELELILRKNEGSVMFDSMDMLVCVFEEGRLCYASNGVPLVHEKSGELMLYRSTKAPKEDPQTDSGFSKACVYYDPEDTFYMLTDGYQKQFGSIRNKKFGFKRIQELLSKIHVESMPLQKKYFENAWRNWSEGHEQTDDITILGLRGYNRTISEETSTEAAEARPEE